MKELGKNILKNILPKKSHFVGIDIGTYRIKVAEVDIVDGYPEVISLRSCPSPDGVWTNQFDEEALVSALKAVSHAGTRDVITCIGGEKLIARLVQLPQMSSKELESAARFEIEKFVPVPLDQLIVRHVLLELIGDGDSRIQNVLLLAVPSAVVYQYYGIFSRAGLTLSAVDFQAFALWRIFGRDAEGVTALLDIGERTSHLVVVKDQIIRFVRLLPVGGRILTDVIKNAFGLGELDARKMKEEASILPEEESSEHIVNQISTMLVDGLGRLTRELQMSLDFFSAQENAKVERLILSGGTSNLKGLPDYFTKVLGLPVSTGFPDLGFSNVKTFDPSFSIAVGLALREVSRDS